MSDGGNYVEYLRRIFERRSQQKQKGAGDRGPFQILGILGSARKDGDTSALASAVFHNLHQARLIDLSDCSIAPYDYDAQHKRDDFHALAQMMTEADAIVFASPVYWYSMSAQMKVFFDRLTDLTDIYKPLGRALAGKTGFLIASGGAAAAPACFEPPFAETARYFQMRWGGAFYASVQDRRRLPPDIIAGAENFATRIGAAISAKKQNAA